MMTATAETSRCLLLSIVLARNFAERLEKLQYLIRKAVDVSFSASQSSEGFEMLLREIFCSSSGKWDVIRLLSFCEVYFDTFKLLVPAYPPGKQTSNHNFSTSRFSVKKIRCELKINKQLTPWMLKKVSRTMLNY